MYKWADIISSLAKSGPNSVARIPVHQMQHPRDAGIEQTFGAPYGQRASYRALLTDGCTLCIEQFDSSYEARLEKPSSAPPRAMTSQSAAAEAIASSTALGALLGLAFGGKKESVLTGALLGGVSGLATIAVTEAASSPETSKAALEFAKTMSALLPLAGGMPSKRANVGRKRISGARRKRS